MVGDLDNDATGYPPVVECTTDAAVDDLLFSLMRADEGLLTAITRATVPYLISSSILTPRGFLRTFMAAADFKFSDACKP